MISYSIASTRICKICGNSYYVTNPNTFYLLTDVSSWLFLFKQGNEDIVAAYFYDIYCYWAYTHSRG